MGEYNLEYSCSFSPAREIIPRCVANIVFTSRLRKIWCTFTKKKTKSEINAEGRNENSDLVSSIFCWLLRNSLVRSDGKVGDTWNNNLFLQILSTTYSFRTAKMTWLFLNLSILLPFGQRVTALKILFYKFYCLRRYKKKPRFKPR